MNDLATGDFASALQMNAFVALLLVPPAIVGLAWWILDSAGIKVPRVRIGPAAVWTYMGVLFLFTVLRNIPALEPYLAP